MKKLIREKGVKQKYVAEEMGISEKTLSAMLNGRQRILASDIEPFCVSLNVTPNELFGYETT